jgi:hypothetical protein
MKFLYSIVPSNLFWGVIIIGGFVALYVAIVRDFIKFWKEIEKDGR